MKAGGIMIKTVAGKKFLIYAAVICIVAVCGVTISYMFAKSGRAENEFIAASVECQVYEQFDGEYKNDISVKNTGNISAFIRVRLVSHWEDENGNIIAKNSVMPPIAIADGWLEMGNNTYCYTAPVKAGESTPSLLAAPMQLKTQDGYNQVVQVFAEAIQSVPSKAASESWNVIVSETADGMIITGLN